MTGLKNARWFEVTLVVLLIILTCTLYVLIVSTPPATKSWEMSGIGNVEHMLIGSDDTLYTFSGNNISAISRDGRLKWSLTLPGVWKVDHSATVESAGRLYLYAFKPLTAGDVDAWNQSGYLATGSWPSEFAATVPYPAGILAISPQGRVAWEHPLTTNVSSWDITGLTSLDSFNPSGPIRITGQNGRIYVFSDYTENVLDDSGKLLFGIGNVSDPAVVDEAGNFYLIKGAWPLQSQGHISSDRDRAQSNLSPLAEEDPGQYWWMMSEYPGYLVPSSVVESYSREGKLLWSTDLGEPVSRPFNPDMTASSDYGHLPMYVNHSIYVSVSNGVAMLDTDGNLKWVSHLSGGQYGLFEPMPFDSAGNVYFQKSCNDPQYSSCSQVRVIGPDGQELPVAWNFTMNFDPALPHLWAGANGTVYTTSGGYINSQDSAAFQEFRETLATKRFDGDTISAYDLKAGVVVWNVTIPSGDIHTVLYNQSNYPPNVYRSSDDPDPRSEDFYEFMGLSMDEVQFKINGYLSIQLRPGNNVTYIYYRYNLGENPVIYNRSRALYATGLYAVDRQGKLLWDLQNNDSVYIVARNDTLYYRTSGGMIGGNSAGLAAGVAGVTAVYLILRFLAIGAVSRARSRLDRNDNRNAVLKFIAVHPGQTARELSRSLGLNLGTLRYHLFILGINHRIVTHEDDKYQRYFPNSNAYTSAERDLLSLMRREPVRKALQVLMEQPGISGRELSQELNLSTTVTHKHITLLVERGIVARTAQQDRSYCYAIKDECRHSLEKLAGRL